MAQKEHEEFLNRQGTRMNLDMTYQDAIDVAEERLNEDQRHYTYKQKRRSNTTPSFLYLIYENILLLQLWSCNNKCFTSFISSELIKVLNETSR